MSIKHDSLLTYLTKSGIEYNIRGNVIGYVSLSVLDKTGHSIFKEKLELDDIDALIGMLEEIKKYKFM
jgi:hypothetical protein